MTRRIMGLSLRAEQCIALAARAHAIQKAGLPGRIRGALPTITVTDADLPRLEYLMRRGFAARLGPQRTDVENAMQTFDGLAQDAWELLGRAGRAAVDQWMHDRPVHA